MDLTQPPFGTHHDAITSRTDYSETQRLGSDMRADGAELLRFPSARDPKQGTNIALFTPRAFALKAPLDISITWTCTVTARRDVSWIREGVGKLESFDFPRTIFLVDGKLPAPAP